MANKNTKRSLRYLTETLVESGLRTAQPKVLVRSTFAVKREDIPSYLNVEYKDHLRHRVVNEVPDQEDDTLPQTDYRALWSKVSSILRPSDRYILEMCMRGDRTQEEIGEGMGGMCQGTIGHRLARAQSNARLLASRPDSTGVRKYLFRTFGWETAFPLSVLMRYHNQTVCAWLLSHRRHRRYRTTQTRIRYLCVKTIGVLRGTDDPTARRAAVCLQWALDHPWLRVDYGILKYKRGIPCRRTRESDRIRTRDRKKRAAIRKWST